VIRDYFFLAVKNVKNRGVRSWLTMLGIFLGIAAVVSLISLGNGLQTAITAQFSSLSTDRLIVTSADAGFGPPGSTAVRKLNENDLEIIESVSGVKITVSRVVRVVQVVYNDRVRFDFVGSIPDDQDEVDFIYDSFNIKLQEGRFLDAIDRKKIILGDDFKRS